MSTQKSSAVGQNCKVEISEYQKKFLASLGWAFCKQETNACGHSLFLRDPIGIARLTILGLDLKDCVSEAIDSGRILGHTTVYTFNYTTRYC